MTKITITSPPIDFRSVIDDAVRQIKDSVQQRINFEVKHGIYGKPGSIAYGHARPLPSGARPQAGLAAHASGAKPVVMIPVSCSFISKIGYEEGRKQLTIHFRSGSRRRYYLVPAAVFKAFMAAESKGSFYNSRVRGCFTSMPA